jgi:carbonic anhydrase
MQAVAEPSCTANMPRVRQWLGHAQSASEIVCTCYAHLSGEPRMKVLTQENVLVQLEHLRTHPAVATALAAGELKLHAWMYKMETGEVFAYDPEAGQFAPLQPGEPAGTVRAPRRAFRDPPAEKPTREATGTVP